MEVGHPRGGRMRAPSEFRPVQRGDRRTVDRRGVGGDRHRVGAASQAARRACDVARHRHGPVPRSQHHPGRAPSRPRGAGTARRAWACQQCGHRPGPRSARRRAAGRAVHADGDRVDHRGGGHRALARVGRLRPRRHHAARARYPRECHDLRPPGEPRRGGRGLSPGARGRAPQPAPSFAGGRGRGAPLAPANSRWRAGCGTRSPTTRWSSWTVASAATPCSMP